jgi:acyl-CoA reductase-like NAD-dependent aldehyde dehydrogenase
LVRPRGAVKCGERSGSGPDRLYLDARSGLAFELINGIEAGYVWVNNAYNHFLGVPLGGVKHSGIGREECLKELLTYTEQKNVSITLA